MEFNFGKRNYQMMIAGVVIIVIGYLLMSGGKSEDPAVFSDTIFSTRRLTIAPLLIISGLVLEVFAILHRAKDE
jgi:fumarate reductase subunit D